MHSEQPYLNGPRHTWLNLSVKTVHPRLLARMVDRCMPRETNFRNLEPPFLVMHYGIPNIHRRHVDVTRARVAFGRRALPKLLYELRNPDPLIVKQTLNSISDLVYDPTKTFEVIQLKILPIIMELLVSEDRFIRERCAYIVSTIVNQELGREAILNDPTYIVQIVSLLNDPVPNVRLLTALTLDTITRFSGHLLDDKWLIPLIIGHIRKEDDLDLLAACIQILKYTLVRTKKLAIDMGALKDMLRMMNYSNDDVCSGALDCIALMTQHPLGAKIGLKKDILLKVKPKLFDSRVPIQTSAATVIMYNTITSAAKLRSLEVDIMDRLMLLADDYEHPMLQFHCIKSLTNMSEAPEGRMFLYDFYQQNIEDIRTGGHDFLERAVAILLRVVRWKP